jgi:FkbM family methyltransferase
MLATRGTVVETTINNKVIRFFVANQNDSIQSCHSKGEFYEREELDIIAKFSRPDRVYVDIGSNVGNHILYVSKFLQVSRIIAFEPNPPALAVLRLNLLLNECSAVDTRFLGLALGSEDGLANMLPDPKHPNNLGGTSAIVGQGGDTVVVPGDALLLNDVEGMEMDVLRGLCKSISRWRPNLFVEVRAIYKEEFLCWLGTMGYAVVQTYDRYKEMSNYMAVPK